MKILVIEDSADYISIYHTLIERMGHTPIITTTGVDALNIVEITSDIGIVIIDLQLPDFDGIDLCRIIHKELSRYGVYTILVTGNHSPRVQKEGLDAGADDFLTKPVDLGILESRIKVGVRTIITQRQLLEERERAETLSIENKLFSQAFDQSQQPTIFTDKNGMITHINEATIDKYGYARDELIGNKSSIFNAGYDVYAEFGYTKDEYINHFRELWNDIINPLKGYWDGYVYNKTNIGEIKEVHLRINSLYNSERTLVGFTALLLDMTEILQKERSIRYSCYHTIVDLAEVRDNETGEHLTRMSIYSGMIAELIGMSRHFVNEIKEFAPFHDIGKVGIPDSILLAPRKLTSEEFNMIKTHPEIGYNILKNAESLSFAAEIAFTHHEKYNGRGYPQGLKGEDIPISGRIIALADVYDALRTRRPYKEPWEHDKVVELIKSESGQHFDPQVVKVFLENHEHFHEISEKYNNDKI